MGLEYPAKSRESQDVTRLLLLAKVGTSSAGSMPAVFHFLGHIPMNKEKMQAVFMILAVVGAVAFIQRKVYAIPVIGEYLPK